MADCRDDFAERVIAAVELAAASGNITSLTVKVAIDGRPEPVEVYVVVSCDDDLAPKELPVYLRGGVG